MIFRNYNLNTMFRSRPRSGAEGLDALQENQY
jgi:hypothetical protein